MALCMAPRCDTRDVTRAGRLAHCAAHDPVSGDVRATPWHRCFHPGCWSMAAVRAFGGIPLCPSHAAVVRGETRKAELGHKLGTPAEAVTSGFRVSGEPSPPAGNGETRKCGACGTDLSGFRAQARYCSDRCRKRAANGQPA